MAVCLLVELAGGWCVWLAFLVCVAGGFLVVWFVVGWDVDWLGALG